MNEILNKGLLAGDKFMPKIHLRQPRFTYSLCGTFTKNKRWTKKIKQKGVWRNICKNKLDKACFQYDFAYGVF